MIRHHFRIGIVAATVDAMQAGAGFASHPELLRQVAIADRLIVTKTDFAAAETVASLRRRLCRLNPQATIVEAVHGALDPDLLLRENHDDLPADTRRWRAAFVSAEEAGSAEQAVRPHGAIRSFCLTADEPVPWSAFGLWFSLLVHRHGARLLRVKSLLDVRGSQTPAAPGLHRRGTGTERDRPLVPQRHAAGLPPAARVRRRRGRAACSAVTRRHRSGIPPGQDGDDEERPAVFAQHVEPRR